MSLVRQGTFIHLIVTIFLIHLIGGCFGSDEYDKYRTEGPVATKCGYNMECVPKHICDKGTVNTAGVTILMQRMNCNEDEVCCRLGNEDDEEEPLPTANACGYREKNGVDKTKVRGSLETDKTEFGEFPWMLVILSNTEQSEYYGGASLIHPQVALTAAHIIDDKPRHTIKVRAGEWTLAHQNEFYPHQDHTVLKKIIHENFRKDTLHYDIALLFLNKPFTLMPHINTVCLPPADLRINGVSCIATGWGQYASNKDVVPEFLKKVSLDVVRNPICQMFLRRTYLSRFFKLHGSFICAGGEAKKDTCFGDGGSPLVCPIPNKRDQYYQVGIVSWGLDQECGEQDVPGVYAGIVSLRSWVDRKMSAEGYDSSTYTAV